MSTFSGFPKGTPRFLRDLSKNNDKAWFEAHREAYEEFYLAPAIAFVEALGPRLLKLAPDAHVEPALNKSIRRIYRDTRFSKDKTPYKDHLDLHFKVGDDAHAPGFFLRLMARSYIVGGGTYRFEKTQLGAFREQVQDAARGKQLATLTARLTRAGFEVGRAGYKRVPRGLDPEHPRGELLRHDALYALREEPLSADVHAKGFVTTCMRQFKKTAPLLEWLRAL